jgi:hypothetical protein
MQIATVDLAQARLLGGGNLPAAVEKGLDESSKQEEDTGGSQV